MNKALDHSFLEGLPDDEAQLAVMAAGYADGRIVDNTVGSFIGTLLVCGVAWVTGTTSSLSFAGVFVAICLILVQVPLMRRAGEALERADHDAFRSYYFVQAQAQFSWALWLGVIGGAFVPPIIAMLMTLWVVHDSRLIDTQLMRASWLAMFPVFNLLVIGIELLPGIAVLPPLPAVSILVAIVALQLFLAGLFYSLIGTLAQEARIAQDREREHTIAIGRLERAQAERALLFKVSHLLGRGLALSRFWHDARNVVQSVVLDGPYLRETWEPHLHRIEPASEREEVAEALINVELNSKHLADMLREVKRTLGGAEELEAMEPRVLADSVLAHVRKEMRIQGAVMPPVQFDIEDDVHLWVPESQVRALGNVMLNGAVRTLEGEMIFRGRRLSAERYRFDVVDRGVEGAARDLAIRRVRARLDLADFHGDEAEGRDSSQPGFGLGLMFAKVQIVGRGGEISVEANEDGPGLTFHVVLQRPFGAPETNQASAPASEVEASAVLEALEPVT